MQSLVAQPQSFREYVQPLCNFCCYTSMPGILVDHIVDEGHDRIAILEWAHELLPLLSESDLACKVVQHMCTLTVSDGVVVYTAQLPEMFCAHTEADHPVFETIRTAWETTQKDRPVDASIAFDDITEGGRYDTYIADGGFITPIVNFADVIEAEPIWRLAPDDGNGLHIRSWVVTAHLLVLAGLDLERFESTYLDLVQIAGAFCTAESLP